ncbi:MAG: helix-turn-helix transcriptional regulator [Clostridia bacterium]|nr:helix-turn-helix transcriptional regulator [Clostridia bacterium]
MKENMGQIIKRLRKERNITQEELAEQLNISAQAISKWENGMSMPDISQVVPLANLFGVPTDVLFGVYGTEHEKEVHLRLKEIYEIYDGCKDGEEGKTALIILDKYRDALRAYPNNATLLSEASAFGTMILQNYQSALKPLVDQKGIDDLANEIIRWSELVIKYSSSTDYMLSAKSRLIDIYVLRKNWDAAYTLAETFPNNVNNIRCLLLAELKHSEGNTDGERMQRYGNIETLSSKLGYEISMLGNLYMREGRIEDALYCYSAFRNIVEAMYRDEAYRPPFIHNYYPMYRSPAECLVKLGREEEAIDLLEEGVDFILAQAENYNKKRYLNVPLLRDYSFGYGHDGNAEYHDLKGKLQRFVSGDAIKSLEKYSRYKTLFEKVAAIQ